MIVRRRPKKHTDKTRFLVSALFLHGFSERQIVAKLRGVATLSKGQVSGILNKTPFRGIDTATRQEWLDKLKVARMDAGLLEDFVFTATSKDERGGAR